MQYIFNSYSIINTRLGKVKGLKRRVNNKDLFIFYQIPYAIPPLKSLRWKKPIMDNMKYDEEYDATKYTKIPYQNMRYYYKYYNQISYNYFIKKPKYKETEDCLYLDIYTPTIERNNLPVVVCIYGGHFQYGYSKDLVVNRELVVEKGIIYITLNYRLGIFGFFQHPELKKDTKYNSYGNYGIMDIICALEWIKRNIFWYGGDPENITLQGQGSGANIIIYLMSNIDIKEKKLFKKAIIQSYSKLYDIGNNRIKESIEIGDMLVGQGKNQILRLRNIDADTISNIYKTTKNFREIYIPNIDNNIIKDYPYNIFRKGLQMKIPIIIGINIDDGSLLYKMGLKDLIKYPKDNNNYTEDDKDELNAIYININKNREDSKIRYYNDYIFTHISKMIAEEHTKYSDTYFYIMKYINIYGINIDCCYELDNLYFLNNNNCNNIYILDKLKNKILLYISTFIKTDDPNSKNNKITRWKEFQHGLCIYFNEEIYMNFFKEFTSLQIMDEEYKNIINI